MLTRAQTGPITGKPSGFGSLLLPGFDVLTFFVCFSIGGLVNLSYSNMTEQRGVCVPKVKQPEPCTGGKVRQGNRCVCPGQLVDFLGLCVPCPPGQQKVGERCQPIPRPAPTPAPAPAPKQTPPLIQLPQIPNLQPIPMIPICPDKHRWNPNTKQCEYVIQ